MAALVGEAVARGVPERFHSLTPQFGAIVSPTDALAPTEILRRLGPPSLVIVARLLGLRDKAVGEHSPQAAIRRRGAELGSGRIAVELAGA
jgi:hypothetical protein